ncbi:helical backbone metal receptor [Desulfosporosinus sp. Sb-LF]|uniref:helical backbone metal receptor n=1 Tax=Desulfosporosinus sp. Sb-LF TaxID=2560027 RepID=UPI00107FBE1C|nr:helical backbone metal receptor [Desulfosporosinus sp. Sb-LF]TGE31177.1 Fe3+-hydroxamate ABC transporter substrate-binding protein [Desulfosporosinus sp. Sb-LF]
MLRLISLVPSITETLYALGFGAEVVGVTEQCDYPEDARIKEKIGTFAQPDRSRILALKPDLVLGDGALHQAVLEKLRRMDVNVLAFQPKGVEEILSNMQMIGRFSRREPAVDGIVEAYRLRINEMRRESWRERPRVLRIMTTEPYIIPGLGSYQYDALQIAGAKLMPIQSEEAYVKVRWEEIVAFDPEVILFCGVESHATRPRRCKGCTAKLPICQRTVEDIVNEKWLQLSAVRENRIFPLACETICRPGPRLIEGMERLNQIFCTL